MAVHEILKMGDERLLRVAKPVTEFDTDALHLLVADMFETMRAVNGAGLAAPQIAVDLQLVIFGTDAVNPRYPDAPLIPRTVLLNPVVTPLGSEEEVGWEGCLSVPGLRGMVPRWSRIRYTGFDPFGEPIEREADGFHARVVQHECDHLIGKLYPMRVRDFTKFGYTQVLFPGLERDCRRLRRAITPGFRLSGPRAARFRWRSALCFAAVPARRSKKCLRPARPAW